MLEIRNETSSPVCSLHVRLCPLVAARRVDIMEEFYRTIFQTIETVLASVSTGEDILMQVNHTDSVH